MKKLIFILSAIIFFIACNDNKTGGIMGGGGWSASDKEKWMTDCAKPLYSSMSEDVAKKYCNCVLEQLEKKYSNYNEMNRKGSYEEGQAYGKNCTYIITDGQKGGGDDNTNGGEGLTGGWSSSDEQKFMSTCIQNAMNTGADETTSRTHCDCTLKKIQKKYNSYDEADRGMTQSEVSALEQECLEERNMNN